MVTKFNSQICTTREQSERLLALGLKKETADMYWLRMVKDYKGNDIPTIRDKWWLSFVGFTVGAGFEQYECIPAWSLHRLWELDNINYIRLDNKEEIAKLYDCIIDNIEAQIKEGNFNKEYLV